MDCLPTVTIFCLLFCVQGVLSQTGGTGQQCKTTSPPCTQIDTDTCQFGICKIKVGFRCLGPTSTHCVMGSRCVNETCSTCDKRYFIVDSKDNTLCAAAETYVGGSCSGTGQGTCKDRNAQCHSECMCKAGYTRALADNSCETASAAGLTLSTTLLLAALLVTSHFL